MNRDRIEGALRRPGPREQGYQPEALPASPSDARRLRARPRRLLAAARVGMLSAAVVAGAAVAIVLTHGSGTPPGGPGTGGGSPTASPSPTPTVVASSSPASVAACRAEDFAWTTDPWGGAAGSRGTNVLARGVTSLAGCEIHGRAMLVLRDANGQALLSAQSAASNVAVHAGTMLGLGISWSNWCGTAPMPPLSLFLTLPGDTREVPLVASPSQIPVPPCLGPGQPSVLNATDFQLSNATPPPA